MSEATPDLPDSSMKARLPVAAAAPPFPASSPSFARRSRFFFAIGLAGEIDSARSNACRASPFRPSSLRAFPSRLKVSRSFGKSSRIDRLTPTASSQRLSIASATACLVRSFFFSNIVPASNVMWSAYQTGGESRLMSAIPAARHVEARESAGDRRPARRQLRMV